MEPLLVVGVGLVVLYGCLCGLVTEDENPPRWLRWPRTGWNAIAYSWRRPAPAPRRPDYGLIARLERELGIGAPESEPGRPIRQGPRVCLTKDCGGDTDEIRTWSGRLVARIHRCG